jgi:adenosylhomocysteine nucleosidase
MSSTRVIGIMGAMPEEIAGVVDLMTNVNGVHLGQRIYYTGLLNGHRAVVVFSRWGKVAAATTVSTLVLHFGITELIFTGVAGGVNAKLNIGDVVIAERLVQHDMDARPLLPRFEVPLLEKIYFETDSTLRLSAITAVTNMVEARHLHQITEERYLKKFGIEKPALHTGDVASGDHFFSTSEARHRLLEMLPQSLCVEMEGAAVAQVCYEYHIPFVVIRTISDTADEHSPIDFPLFVRHIASRYSVAIIKHML